MFSTMDGQLNPVLAMAKTVKRVWGYENASEDSKICLFQNKEGIQSHIISDQVRDRLRAVVKVIGEEALGFTSEDIGLHSIRSGGAMAMFLSGVSTIIIQRIGRWSSKAFLEYIREQVESFTVGVSQKMLDFEQFFALGKDTRQSIEVHNSSQNIKIGPERIPFDVQFSKFALENDLPISKGSRV